MASADGADRLPRPRAPVLLAVLVLSLLSPALAWPSFDDVASAFGGAADTIESLLGLDGAAAAELAPSPAPPASEAARAPAPPPAAPARRLQTYDSYAVNVAPVPVSACTQGFAFPDPLVPSSCAATSALLSIACAPGYTATPNWTPNSGSAPCVVSATSQAPSHCVANFVWSAAASTCVYRGDGVPTPSATMSAKPTVTTSASTSASSSATALPSSTAGATLSATATSTRSSTASATVSATATASPTATATMTVGVICPLGGYAPLASLSCTPCPYGVSTPAIRSLSVAACTVCAPNFFGTVLNAGTVNATGCTPCSTACPGHATVIAANCSATADIVCGCAPGAARVGTTTGLGLKCRYPNEGACSSNVILGSTTLFRRVAAGASGNTLGAEIVASTADACSILAKSSGNLRCSSASGLSLVSADGEPLFFVAMSADLPQSAPNTCSA